MRIKKQPLYIRLLIAIGLIMVISPLLLSNYMHIPYFVRGALSGAGLGFEIIGLIMIKRRQKAEAISGQ